MRSFALIVYRLNIAIRFVFQVSGEQNSITTSRQRQVRHLATRINLYYGLKSYIALQQISSRNRNILILINDTLAR